MAEITIRLRPNGPLVIEGTSALDGLLKIVDQNGAAFPIPANKPIVALCRCGQSANKPFCDGAQGVRIHFAGIGSVSATHAGVVEISAISLRRLRIDNLSPAVGTAPRGSPIEWEIVSRSFFSRFPQVNRKRRSRRFPEFKNRETVQRLKSCPTRARSPPHFSRERA